MSKTYSRSRSARRRPNLSRKAIDFQGGEGKMEDEGLHEVNVVLGESLQSPPPGFTPHSTPTVRHKYGTRQAKSFLELCVGCASKSPSPTLKRARRILPGSNEITGASENLMLDVKQQTEVSEMFTTTEAHYALSTTGNGAENETAYSARSDNFALTEVLMLAWTDNDEVDSAPDTLLVIVDGYKVKPETALLLKKIFAKYGDIVKESTFKSVEYRSSFLDSVCSIYQRLETMNLLDISPGEVKSMLNLVNDLEAAKVEVGWIRCRLEKIYEAKDLMKGAFGLKETKLKAFQEIEVKEKAIVEAEQELEAHKEACQRLGQKIEKLKDEVDTSRDKVENMSALYSDTKATVKLFYQRSLVHDLL